MEGSFPPPSSAVGSDLHRVNRRRSSDPALTGVKIYVGGLDLDTTDDDLLQLFSKIGQVTRAEVVIDSKTQKSLGFGYVTYGNVEDAMTAIKADELKAKGLRILRPIRSPKLLQMSRIYFEELDSSCDQQQFQGIFSAFGKIFDCKLNSAGKSRKYGFVAYDGEESARRAIEGLDGKVLGSMKVRVGPYLSQEELQKQRDLQMKQGLVIHVSDLNAWLTDEDELWHTFSDCGTITSCKVVRDKQGLSLGYGFITFSTASEAKTALSKKQVYFTVQLAQSKEDRAAMSKGQLSPPVYPRGVQPQLPIPSTFPPPVYPRGLQPQLPIPVTFPSIGGYSPYIPNPRWLQHPSEMIPFPSYLPDPWCLPAPTGMYMRPLYPDGRYIPLSGPPGGTLGGALERQGGYGGPRGGRRGGFSNADDAGEASKENPVTEVEEKEQERTLEEYEKVFEEKRKAFPALKSEERKVELDKDFETMQLLPNKKNEEEFFVKLGSNKDKRKEAGKEAKAKKVLNLNEFLKPAEGERYYGPGRGRGRGRGPGHGRGPGRGRGPGPSGGHGGIMGHDVPGPEIEDQQQFPNLGSK